MLIVQLLTTLTFAAPSLPDGAFSDTVYVVVIAINQFGVGLDSNPVTTEIYSMYIYI